MLATYEVVGRAANGIAATAFAPHTLRVHGIVAEYFDALSSLNGHDGHTMLLFLGSNIGNFRRGAKGDMRGDAPRQFDGDT